MLEAHSARASNMTDKDQYPKIPSTRILLLRIKRPKQVIPLSKAENYVVGSMVALFLLSLGCMALLKADQITQQAAKVIVLPLTGIIMLLGLVFFVIQVVQFFLLFRHGFNNMADRVDVSADADSALAEDLSHCNTQHLDQRSKLLEQESKLLTRRAGLASAATAISALIINLLSTGNGDKAAQWVSDAKLLITCCSLGLLAGAVIVIIFAGKLEKISTLLKLASERGSQRKLEREMAD
ncbi:TPA: hypothetical protein UMY98_002306 [Stenotrophomonas maltophilia]|nr:hypothetical protein [Stenotrophomonas maltophilia]